MKTTTSPWVLVLDDDPTGTQGVAGVPVVIAPSTTTFHWAAQRGNCVYALTNTRAMSPAAARKTVAAFLEPACSVARELGRELSIINRSDSTLRGHFPLEIQQLQQMVPRGHYRGCLLVPAFPDAGRVTIDGIHYVRRQGRLTPAAKTEFATDATFGYTESRLTEWARSRVPASWRIVHMPSGTFERGEDAVAEFLDNQPDVTLVCPSIRHEADLAVLAAAQRRLEGAGVRYLVQAGPSYPRHLAGISATRTIDLTTSANGVVVVGSHTQLTTSQVAHAQARFQLTSIEIDVNKLLTSSAPAEITRCVNETTQALGHASVVLATSRQRKTGTDEAHSLAVANQVGRGVAEVTRQVNQVHPGFIVSKGGITSRDVAAVSLGWAAAMVEGPLVDQTLPVWAAWDPDAEPTSSTRLVIFPGNVGEDDLLTRALDHLNVRRRQSRLGTTA